VVAAVVLLMVAAVAATSLLTGGPSATPTPTARPASASPSVAPSVLAALDRVDAAIEAARGGKDGLNGRDANELGQLAGSVQTAVQRNDLGAATTAASTLADRARALSGGLEADRRQPLLDAVAALGKAL